MNKAKILSIMLCTLVIATSTFVVSVQAKEFVQEPDEKPPKKSKIQGFQTKNIDEILSGCYEKITAPIIRKIVKLWLTFSIFMVFFLHRLLKRGYLVTPPLIPYWSNMDN